MFFCCFASGLKAQLNISDSFALVDLYNNTNGPNWTNKNGWLTNTPASNWFGVTIVTNRVVSISLNQNNLIGFLPSSIGDFGSLQTLSLNYNHLSGSIPPEIGNLKQLQFLNLSVNQFNNSIPAQLGDLSEMQVLDLSFNNLRDALPPSLANFSKAKQIILHDNRFTFAGMELLAKTYGLNILQCSPQPIIPVIATCQRVLYVSAGGTPANNIYHWYDNGTLVATTVADSSFKPLNAGQYYVIVNNSVVTSLTLYSNTNINLFSMGSLTTKSENASVCAGKVYVLPSGKTVDSSGVYIDTSYDADCNELILTLHLSVTSVQATTINASICAGEKYTLPSGEIADKSGIYYDTIRTSQGCDSIVFITDLTVNDGHLVNIDTAICEGEFYKLSSGKLINTPGQYVDSLKSIFGCDSVIISLDLSIKKYANFSSKLFPADTSFCSGEDLLLNAGNAFTSYLWNTGETFSSITIKNAGTYWVTAKDTDRCIIASDTIIAQKENCSDDFFVPSAFSPNNDGLNDILKPRRYNNFSLLQYEFIIYNRYGQKVFESNNPDTGWNGKVNGNEQNAEVYVWILKYHFENRNAIVKKGTAVLMR